MNTSPDESAGPYAADHRRGVSPWRMAAPWPNVAELADVMPDDR